MGTSPSAGHLGSGSEQVSDRRQAPRVRVQLPIEIRTKGTRFAIRGETIDVSVTGCYVGSMQPMAVGTEIEFRCWVGARPIDCKAVIRTCDPCVGNGIEFLELDDLSKSILGYHLHKLQSEEVRENERGGIIGITMVG